MKPDTDKISALGKLKEAALQCQRCSLRQGCRGVVFGEGNPFSPVMFVGEGPGQTEDELGRPFVGKAGQLLNTILEAAGIKRQDVYITNIVKCRPPGNRTPNTGEMETCLPWLREQFRIIRPSHMVLLGLAATHGILDPGAKMGQVRGRWIEKGNLKIMATYHPAAILRNSALKRPVWEDFQLISSTLSALANPNPPDPPASPS